MRTFAKKLQANQQTTSAKYLNPSRPFAGQSRDVHSILHLHRTIGNQAVQQLLQSNADALNAVLTGTASPHFGHDFSRVPVSPPTAGAIQTKLSINTPGDEYEQEADFISEEVIRIPEPRFEGADPSSRSGPHPRGYRSALPPSARATVTDPAGIPAVVHNAIASPSSPLDAATRAFMEPRFGRDFRGVRVHVGSRADAAAGAVQARAFTLGGDIVFRKGEYAPATAPGRKLLAHELTHVVQQSGNLRGPAPGTIQRDVLPRRPVETRDYELQRLISELNDHVDHGRTAEAQALVPRIRTLLSLRMEAMQRGLEAAEAFLRLGLRQEALEVLQHSREAQFPAARRRVFDTQAIDLLLRSGEQAVAGRQWGRARELFREALRRVEEHLFSGAHAQGLEAERLRQFAEQAIYRIMGGLIAVVHHHREAAERAYRGQDPDARRHMLRARQSIRTIENDLQSVLDASAVVMPIEHPRVGERTATYRDVSGPSIALPVTHYIDEGGEFYDFQHRRRRVSAILDTLRGQVAVVTDIYEYDWQSVALYRSRYGRAPDIHVLEDRRRLWALKFDRLRDLGYSVRNAVQALLESISDYLRFFSIHTEYDIDDAMHDPITADFPRAITQQALMDCGVYALRTAYELSLIRDRANLEFHYVSVPEHVYLGIVDRDHTFGWALSNNQFSPIDASDIRGEGVLEGVGVGVAVARTFNMLPSPVRTQIIGEFAEEALVASLNVLQPHLYLPPDYHRLSREERDRAQERAVELEAEHGELRDAMARQLSLVIADLRRVRDRVERLVGDMDDDFGDMDDDFREENGRMLAAHLPRYEELSEQAHRHYSTVGRVLGSDPRRYTTDCPYCELTWKALRYAGHVLRQAHVLESDFVQVPAIIVVDDPDYAGDPPPWERLD